MTRRLDRYRVLAMVLLFSLGATSAPAGRLARDVDVAIVLAVDTSHSIDGVSARRQKNGHVQALRSARVLDAIRRGPHGCIAITYIEWASSGSKQTILPWSVICDREEAAAAARQIETMAYGGVGRRFDRRTSLSYAIDVGRLLLDQYPAQASRKVIDISSNGTNNDGVPVIDARARAVDRGYIINAIVLADAEPGVTGNLAGYFKDNVIGGSGAFVIKPKRPDDYSIAILRKLVQEIAGMAGKPDFE